MPQQWNTLTIKQAIDQADMTQATVAYRLAVSAGLVSMWCSGKRRVYADQARRLAGILGFDMVRIDWCPDAQKPQQPP